ncbi:MAG: hypothetical protein FJ295_04035 [Planctomycetes bacterium]|nr:hypothetical protein [Planctomycetota bacterium]
MRLMALILAAGLGFGISAQAARADHFREANRILDRLERLSDDLVDDIRGHFRGVPHFVRLLTEASRLHQRVCGLRHQLFRGPGWSVERELSQLDRSLHSLEDLLEDVDDWQARNRNRSCPRVNVRPAARLLVQLHDQIEDLQDELRENCRFDRR